MLKFVIFTITITLLNSKYVSSGIGKQSNDSPANQNIPEAVRSLNIEIAETENQQKTPETKSNDNIEEKSKEVAKNETQQTKVKVVNKDPEPEKKVAPEISTGSVTVPKSYPKQLIQSGALLRGFYVFLGLSAVTVFYFVYRSYRLRHGGQVSTTVRKYGVTARRSDLEMRHLELDDDEDDTLFEINQNINR